MTSATAANPILRPSVDEASIEIPADARTHEGFRRWVTTTDFPPHVRLTYIRGRILIDMSPERLKSHNPLKTELTRVMSNLVYQLDLGRFYIDRALITHQAAELSSEPDAMFASWQTLESDRLQYKPMVSNEDDSTELVGTPDWVAEIISPGSVRHDTQDLMTAYHKAGIPEYWLLDARGQTLDFQLLVYQPNGYEAIKPQRGWFKSHIFPRRFKFEIGKDRLGDLKYTLHVK